MFKEERIEPIFDWNMIGNIAEGRPNLGETTSVAVYRLMQFTIRDILISKLMYQKQHIILLKMTILLFQENPSM